jgi:DNA-binding SARP family transcriptional activator
MPTLRLYGAATLTLDAGQEIALAAREAALLAWLHLEGPTPRARLAALLWPSGDESRGRTNLRQTLARLRRAAGEVLAEDDGVLALAAGVHVLPAEGAELLAGLQFDDADELAAWLAARRDDTRRTQQRATLAAAQQCLAAGDLDGALAQADVLLAQEPESEQAWRIRMEALYLAGDRAAAIAAWDECREALRRAFGVAPSQATNELGRLILDSAARVAASKAVLPAALRRPPQLIGRAGVLGEVERCLQLRHAVVIAGPGGIGKSRLLAHVLQAQEPALLVAARAGDRVQPGASFARLLQAALKRFAPVLDADTQRDLAVLLPEATVAPSEVQSALEHRRVLGAAARALQACAQNGLRVVALDDLQFADEASIAALRVLLGAWIASEDAAPGRTASTALPTPLLALRDAELSDDGRALLAQLADSRRSARFDLAPLGAAELRALLDTLPAESVGAAQDRDGLAAALHAQVGGNPAFVLESLKSLWLEGVGSWQPGQALPLPATLLETLRRRLQRLPEAALQIAQLAAVAETDFSLGLAAAALGKPPLALAPVFAELEAAQVFQGQAFSHDLVAEAVRATVPAALVPPLHQLIADHLRSAPVATSNASRIAHHLTQAGAARAAAPWWLRAAEQARSRWQVAEAARSFETAAQALAEAGEDAALQAELGKSPRAAAVVAWRDAARCWSRADRDALGVRALDAADALAQTERERLLNASTRVALQINAGDLAQSVETARRLARALRDGGQALLSGAELGEAARFICAAVPYGVPGEEALALCEAVQDRVAAEGPAALVSLQSGIGTALHWDARLREADARLSTALASAGEDVNASVRIYLGNRLARVRHSLGELERALDVGLATLAFAERTNAGIGARTNLMYILGLMQIGHGAPAAGLAMLDAAVALDSGQPSQSECADLAVAHLAVGQIDAAERWLERTGITGTAAFALHDQVALLARARIAAARGAAADAPVQALLQLLAEPLPVGVTLLLQAALLRWHAPGEAEIDALLAELERRDMKALLRCALNGAARIALARANKSRAAELARRALQLAAHVDLWCEEPAQVWVTAHDVLAACGHAEEAQQAKAAGAAWVRARAAQWTDPAARTAWLEGQPLHRALLG